MLNMYINNEEVVCSNNIQIKEEILSTSSTILKNCYPKSWELTKDYVSNFYFPKDYSQCKIFYNDELKFCGVVKNTGKIKLNPYAPKYCDIQVLDYKCLLSEGKTLDFVIDDKTIEEAINMVVDNISEYGVEVGEIELNNKDDKIYAYSTLEKTAYDVFQYICEIANCKWFTRLKDENTIVVDFYDIESLPQKENIKYTKEYFEKNKIVDMNYSFSTNDYRNKQIILSDSIIGNVSQNDTIISNGYDKQFNTTQLIAEIEYITVEGDECTFATKQDKELGIVADFYYTPGTNVLESEEEYNPNIEIEVQYKPVIKGRMEASNIEEISRINSQIGRTGIISRYERRNDLASQDDLLKVANTYLQYKGSKEISLVIKTENVDLFNIGDKTHFDIDLEELAVDYMVKNKTIDIIQNGSERHIFYTFTLSSNFDSESAINYFDNQRRKNEGNLSKEETISRNIYINNELNINFVNLTKTKQEFYGDNVLNCELNSPFIE